jgi:hypothetical protein
MLFCHFFQDKLFGVFQLIVLLQETSELSISTTLYKDEKPSGFKSKALLTRDEVPWKTFLIGAVSPNRFLLPVRSIYIWFERLKI